MTLRQMRTRVTSQSLDPVTEKLFSAVLSGDVWQLKMLESSRLGQKELKGVLDNHNESGCTSLGMAAEKGLLETAEELLKYGASVDKVDFYGQTALHYATEHGHVKVANALIKAGADVNKCVNLSAMHIAACKGQTEVAKLLLLSGCDVNAQDSNGVTVLHCAVANEHADIVLALLEAGAKVNLAGHTTHRTPIYLAVDLQRVDILSMLIKYRAKLNHKDDYGMTPLCVSCLQNNTDIATVLVKAGSKVDIPDNKGNLPIHYTARNGNVELTEALLKNGSGMDVLNSNFSGPLHLAVSMGHVEIVKTLVDKGCDVNFCDQYGLVTALHIAVNSYSDIHIFSQVLEILIQGGCWLDSRAFSTLETALYRAIDQNKSLLALALLQHGASPSIESPFDITILQKACQKGQMAVIHTIIYSDIDWSRETWLETDIYQSGINPKLLEGYQRDIPMTLYKNHQLFYEILEIRHNPPTLLRLSRIWVRRYLNDKLFLKTTDLEIPSRLKNFLMFKIL